MLSSPLQISLVSWNRHSAAHDCASCGNCGWKLCYAVSSCCPSSIVQNKVVSAASWVVGEAYTQDITLFVVLTCHT